MNLLKKAFFCRRYTTPTIINFIFLIMIGWPILLCAANELPAWQDDSCGFKKVRIDQSPSEIFKQFIERDSKGQFLKTDSWFNNVVLCPGHMGGADFFWAISKYSIKKSKIKGDSVSFDVEYDVVGSVTSGGADGELNAFNPAKKQDTVHYELVKTPFGWRIKGPENWAQRLLVNEVHKNLPHENWVEGDLKKFETATNLNGYK